MELMVNKSRLFIKLSIKKIYLDLAISAPGEKDDVHTGLL
jgi:hypothetical protein